MKIINISLYNFRPIIVLIVLFYLLHSFIFKAINSILISNEILLPAIDIAMSIYEGEEKDSVILDKEMTFYENDLDDIIKVRNGQSFGAAMKEYGFDDSEIYKVTSLMPSYVKKIAPGQDIFISYDYKGIYRPKSDIDSHLPREYAFYEKYSVKELDIRLNRTEDHIRITRDGNAMHLNVSQLATKKHIAKVKSKINSSLYVDGVKNGLPPTVINRMIQEYSYDIDFQRDIHKDDKFEALFEEYYDDKDRKVKDGRLIYAALNIQGKWYKMYSYLGSFYNEKGQAIRKTLLKTPVDGARISSGFGIRKHPVLGYTRAHKGIDFAAPTGTPIYSAGDGVVTFIGIRGGYGKFVSVKHNKTYSTNYGHMSRFAKIKVGQSIKQRQVIGYVGMTGLASGPHLHFELVKDGQQINPTKHTIQSNVVLVGKQMSQFIKEVEIIDKSMSD